MLKFYMFFRELLLERNIKINCFDWLEFDFFSNFSAPKVFRKSEKLTKKDYQLFLRRLEALAGVYYA